MNMAKRCVMVLLALLIILSSLTFAQEITTKDNSQEKDCIDYFYGKDCDDCLETNTFINGLSDTYPQLSVKKIEVYYNPNNYDQLQQLYTAYNVDQKQQGLPAVFTSTGYLIGKKPIFELLEKYILENNNSACPDIISKEVLGIVGDRESSTILGALSFIYVSNAAVTHFTHPVTFALIGIVLLLVILSIALGNDRALMFRRGLAFIFGAFLIYFLYGIGLFTGLAQPEITTPAHFIIAIILILASLFLVLKFLFSKKDLFERRSHPVQQALKKKITLMICPLCTLILGILFGLFTLTGFHKAFGWMRFLIMQQVSVPSLIVMLLYFLLIWILLPLVVSALLFLIRDKGEDAGERGMWIWKKQQLKALNVVLSIIALALGIIAVIV